jgi:lectin, mannose-binding 2
LLFPATGSIPEWTAQGAVSIMENLIRLTSNQRDQWGILSHDNLLSFESGSLELSYSFKIHSDSPFGADGMVFWISEEPIKHGMIFGAADTWTGIAIVMDTYDNNDADSHPLVSIHSNDGTKEFQFEHDGSTTHVGGCSFNYRHQLASVYFKIDNGFARVRKTLLILILPF